MPQWKKVTSASTRIQQRYPYRQGGPHGFDRSPDDCQCHSGRTGPQVESISVAAARQSHEKPSPALGTRVVQHRKRGLMAAYRFAHKMWDPSSS
jgi:hypothetical protein